MFLSCGRTDMETLFPITHPCDCAFGSFACVVASYSKSSITGSKRCWVATTESCITWCKNRILLCMSLCKATSNEVTLNEDKWSCHDIWAYVEITQFLEEGIEVGEFHHCQRDWAAQGGQPEGTASCGICVAFPYSHMVKMAHPDGFQELWVCLA